MKRNRGIEMFIRRVLDLSGSLWATIRKVLCPPGRPAVQPPSRPASVSAMSGKRSRLSAKAFDDIVSQAIARIPMEIRRHLDNMLITVEDEPDDEMLAEAGVPPGETLFGLYWGVPLTERSVIDPPLYPDMIYIFKGPLEQAFSSRKELIEEIEITVVHEIAHALGLTDADLDRLGYG